MSEDQMKI